MVFKDVFHLVPSGVLIYFPRSPFGAGANFLAPLLASTANAICEGERLAFLASAPLVIDVFLMLLFFTVRRCYKNELPAFAYCHYCAVANN